MALKAESLSDIPDYLLAYQKEKPCRHGAVCPLCLYRRLQQRRWVAQNRERHRAQTRASVRKLREADPEAARAKARAWRAANPDKVSRYNRRCHRKNGHKYAEGNKAWKAANPESVAASAKQSRAGRFHEDPEAVRQEWHTAQQRRRARLNEAFVEDVRYEDIYDRDGGMCHICGLEVPEDSSDHHLRGTLDHVAPLAEGGLHEHANIKLAHSLCNSVKHAKSSVTQEKRRSLIRRIGSALSRAKGG